MSELACKANPADIAPLRPACSEAATRPGSPSGRSSRPRSRSMANSTKRLSRGTCPVSAVRPTAWSRWAPSPRWTTSVTSNGSDACILQALRCRPTTPLIVGLPADAERAARLASKIDRSAAVAALAPLGTADPIRHVLTVADCGRRAVIPYLPSHEHADVRFLEALIDTDVVVGLKDGLRDPLNFRRLRRELGSVPITAASEDAALG